MYMSPERLAGKAYSYPADIWSFGLCLVTLAKGKFPMRTDQGFWGIFDAAQRVPILEPPTFSADLCDFVRKVRTQFLKEGPRVCKATRKLAA